MRVDGRLDAECLRDFEASCENARPPLTLNLEGLLWIDDRAIAYLQQILADGTRVTKASPFIALRLKGERQETFPDDHEKDDPC